MRHTLPVLIAATLLPLAAGPAGAAGGDASLCGDRQEILSRLAGSYAEKPIARGFSGTGAVIEILASADGTSFSVIRTTADGRSCLIATGNDWGAVTQRLGDRGA